MAQFNPNKPYRVIRVARENRRVHEIHQPESITTPEGTSIVYSPITEEGTDVIPTFNNLQQALDFIATEIIRGEGSEIVFDSNVDGRRLIR